MSVDDGLRFELEREQYVALLAHCIEGWRTNREACGLLVRTMSGAYVSAVSAENVADAPEHEFVLDPFVLKDQLDAGRVVVGTWHSHNSTDAQPSEMDVACYRALHQSLDGNAGQMRHLIVSMATGQPVTQCWRIASYGESGVLEAVTFAIGV